MGLSMAMSALVGQNIGAGKTGRAEKIARLGIIYGFGALSALGIVAFAMAPKLVAFFVPSDREVITAGAGFLRIMALTCGGIGVQLCVVAVLRASGNMVHAMAIALVSQWVVQFPLAYVLSRHSLVHADRDLVVLSRQQSGDGGARADLVCERPMEAQTAKRSFRSPCSRFGKAVACTPSIEPAIRIVHTSRLGSTFTHVRRGAAFRGMFDYWDPQFGAGRFTYSSEVGVCRT